MPSLTNPPVEFFASIYSSASDIPPQVWAALKLNASNANVMYPHALKTLEKERKGTPPDPNQFWIVIHNDNYSVDFVLSCTKGPLGDYPIFIFSPRPLPQLQREFVSPRVKLLANALFGHVNVKRVYSVFAVDPVSRSFADNWRQLTGIPYYREPYYAARFSFCTRQSLRRRQYTIMPDVTYDLRLARRDDIPAVAALCFGFSSTADPFTETKEQAYAEATHLVENNQVWVHTLKYAESASEDIASIVAVTRRSATVAAITKVFTNPKVRGRKCAERLVRHVTDQLLKANAEKVVLYVAHDNPAATKVYHRVGFKGLDESYGTLEGVEPWMEIGFERSEVNLGMW